MTIKRATLLEWSICSIGSNPDAMVERSAPLLMQKWLQSTAPHHMEDTMKTAADDEMYLEVADDFFEKNTADDFDRMCQQMLATYEEMTSDKFRELMRVQLATLGPNASIADLVRQMCRDGVAAPKSYDIDERELAVTIAKVVADATGAHVRAAFNAALGRLD